MKRSNFSKGLICIILVTVIWSWTTLFIKYLSHYFDVLTQSFFRYFFATLFLFCAARYLNYQEFKNQVGNLKFFLLPALLVFGFQILWVWGTYDSTATLAQLLLKINVIFVILFSLPFEEERKVIYSKSFILGTCLAILGTVGVILGKGTFNDLRFTRGALLIMISSIFWAAYLVSLKPVVAKVSPPVSATWVYILSTFFLLLVALPFGKIGQIKSVPIISVFALIFSGVASVGVGNVLNYTALKHLGATVTNNVALIIPILTGFFSFLVFHETLNSLQLISAGVLLVGCGLVLRARFLLLRVEPAQVEGL